MRRKLTFLILACLTLFFSLPTNVFGQDNIIELPITLELSRFSYDRSFVDSFYIFDQVISQNLFLPLLDYDISTQSIGSKLVQSYSVSGDGLVYTFVLRTDVPWVQFRNGEVVAVRPVTVEDVVANLRQRCTAIDFRFILYRVIAGCSGRSGTVSGIQVIDANTFAISLTEPASYIPALLTDVRNPIVPAETIGLNSSSAFAPERLLTSGNYVLESVKQGEPRTFVFHSNPLLPADLRGSSNIERVIVYVHTDDFNPFDWLESGRSALVSGISGDGINLVSGPPSSFVRVMIFNPDKEPFDDPQVRRAFSAAIDRTLWDYDLPAAQFAPAGIFGALPADTDRVVGFDPAFASSELADAGYPNCQGMPTIDMKISEGQQNLVNTLIAQFGEVLGCTSETFDVTMLSFDEWYRTVSGDTLAPVLPGQVPMPSNALRPNLWLTNTNAIFPDQASYIGFYLDCENSHWSIPCGDEQILIQQAHAEQNPDLRMEIWQSIEEAFFGYNGSYPVAPLGFIREEYVAAPWVNGSPVSYYSGIGNWSNISVDNLQWMRQRNLVTILPEPTSSVSSGETIVGIIDERSPAAAYTISSSEESELNLIVSPTAQSTLDPMVNVYDEGGNLIAFNDDAGLSNLGARISGLPSQTELTVVVYAFNGESQGEFTFRVSGGTLAGTISGTGNVNVRSGPGTSYSIITTLSPGSEVEITGRNADSSWLAVRFDGQDGWLASFLIATTEDIDSLPVVQ